MTNTSNRPPIIGFILNLLGGVLFATCIVLILILAAFFE